MDPARVDAPHHCRRRRRGARRRGWCWPRSMTSPPPHRAAQRGQVLLVPSWTMPTLVRGRGILDLRPGGLAWRSDSPTPGSSSRWRRAATATCSTPSAGSAPSARCVQPSLRLPGQAPFHDRVFAIWPTNRRRLCRRRGLVRKAIVIDLDNTLWAATSAISDGSSSDSASRRRRRSLVDFQRSLKTLQRRGILPRSSKNDEHVALEAIDRHPEMVLRRDDFVAQRINWADKAANIADIAAELNIGLQSIVFIDDNAHERAPGARRPARGSRPGVARRSRRLRSIHDLPAVLRLGQPDRRG